MLMDQPCIASLLQMLFSDGNLYSILLNGFKNVGFNNKKKIPVEGVLS